MEHQRNEVNLCNRSDNVAWQTSCASTVANQGTLPPVAHSLDALTPAPQFVNSERPLKMWAAEHIDDLKARLVGNRCNFNHEACKAVEAQAVADSHTFYDNNLKAMNAKALEHAMAASHQTYL